jgi:hypothetical protein
MELADGDWLLVQQDISNVTESLNSFRDISALGAVLSNNEATVQ